MHDVVPRRVRADDGDAHTLADARLREGASQASDRIGGLAHAPLLARHRVDQGEPLGVAARGGQEGPRGRIIGDHEAEAAFAAAMAA